MTKRILAVDDSPSIRKMVGFTLRSAGYEVVEAEDGQDDQPGDEFPAQVRDQAETHHDTCHEKGKRRCQTGGPAVLVLFGGIGGHGTLTTAIALPS